MKRLIKHSFNAQLARTQWQEYVNLMNSKRVLREKRDVWPFFRTRNDLCLLIGNYFPMVRSADVLAHEFHINDDFRADLIVGDSSQRDFALIEFEDGSPNSIFRRRSPKTTLEWAPRFEQGLSQLVDWFWKLDDMRVTNDFENIFGRRDAKFGGLIVAGKDMKLEPQEEARLRWRNEKVVVNSRPVSCISFDGLGDDLDYWLRSYHNV